MADSHLWDEFGDPAHLAALSCASSFQDLEDKGGWEWGVSSGAERTGGRGRAVGLLTPLGDSHRLLTWRQPGAQRPWAGSEADEETSVLHYLGSNLDEDAVWYENSFVLCCCRRLVLPTALLFIKERHAEGEAVGFLTPDQATNCCGEVSAQMIGLGSQFKYRPLLFISLQQTSVGTQVCEL